MSDPLLLIDSFIYPPYLGNPAAVVLLSDDTGPHSDAWMQRIAQETNAPATAFVERMGSEFLLRWFTPTGELVLCGHGSLAAAHALWESGSLSPDAPARFTTREAGLLTARRDGVWIYLDFPAKPVMPANLPSEVMAEAFGVAPPRFVGRSQHDYLIEFDSETDVRAVRPDMRVLAHVDARGFIVTARSDSAEFDFVSRFFAPSIGITEDHVTGSAHCALGPYWKQRLSKTDLVALQASARGGVLRVRPDADRVMLGGQATTIFRGELIRTD